MFGCDTLANCILLEEAIIMENLRDIAIFSCIFFKYSRVLRLIRLKTKAKLALIDTG